MVTLFCAVVGEEGNAFSIDIEPSKTVDHLKDKIKKKKPQTITDEADKLELFLAKKGDAWLTENEVKRLTENEVKWLTEYKVKQDEVKQEDSNANLFKPLDLVGAPLNLISLSDVPALTIEDVNAKRVFVHVLVVLPNDSILGKRKRAIEGIELTEWNSINPQTTQPFRVDPTEFTLSETPSNTLVQTNQLRHFFDQYGTFPPHYYVREEEKQVWDIMLNRLNEKITVLVGSPGVGKSTLLMMLSFYVALFLEKRVLILRKLKSMDGGGWVYLYIDKSVFSRGVTDYVHFSSIRKYFNYPSVFLDGFNDEEVNQGPLVSILRPFHVLATSCQYDKKFDDPAGLVVLPAWRLNDLQAYAECTNWAKDVGLRVRTHVKMIPVLVKTQYYYSGGSMREFCKEHTTCISDCKTLINVITNEQKCLMLTTYGDKSTLQVDRIRHHFIQDTTNAVHYQIPEHWKTSVDSGWIMKWLQINRDVAQIYEFYEYAKAINGGFHGTAFECLFHHTVKQFYITHTIVLKTSDTSDYIRVELDISSLVCSGTSRETSHEALKSIDCSTYWYPDYSYLPFIDCVCPCRLVDKFGQPTVKLAYIQVTIATQKVFRTHRMMELEEIKENNSSLMDYEAIYLVVTPSKATCDAFKFVEEAEMNENDYDLSDYADVYREDDDDAIEVEQHEETRPWNRVITYLNPESVYRLKNSTHVVKRSLP